MTTDATTHPLISDYLARLAVEARRLPEDQAEELIADVSEHLSAGFGAGLGTGADADPTEADVRNLLDRLGTPAELVDAAGPVATATPVRDSARIGAVETAAVTLLIAAEVIFILIPIAAVMWIVGLVLLAVAGAWSGRQKLRGLLSLGTGFPVVMMALGIFLVPASTTSCASSATTAAGASDVASDVVCTTSGPPAWIGGVILALFLLYLAWQIRSAYVLLSRRGQV